MVYKWFNVQTTLISNLNVTDMQAVNKSLHGIRISSRGCSKGHDSKVRVLGHEESNNLVVCVIARGSVCLICDILSITKDPVISLNFTYHKQHDIACIAILCCQVVNKSLRGHIKDAFLFPLGDCFSQLLLPGKNLSHQSSSSGFDYLTC